MKNMRPIELVALIAISTTLLLLYINFREIERQIQFDDTISVNEIIIRDKAAATPMRARTKIKLEEFQRTSLNPSQLNNTRKAMQQKLFFNRVAKVGSQTFMTLLALLSERNGFGFHQDKIREWETLILNPDEQAALVEMISNFESPSTYIRHVCFTNFSEFGSPEPIYVNLVRDPVERVISWYYYLRTPWVFVGRKMAFPDVSLPDPEWLKKDFEDCVLSGDSECTYIKGTEEISDFRRQSMFFCGHYEECVPFNTDGVLQGAKRAVEQHYAVVGILDDLNTTLTVLEHYIPRFFDGVTEVYYNEINNRKTINKAYKPPVSEEVKNIVRKNFTKEIEFYEFCRQRLHKQLYALRLPDKR